ncbi:MAG: hypothetical protein J7L76_08480 [Spirochaetaceae bacterium]|nr:hypothetical protein [Spirochaetaceae bacterium]RKX87738.1 MAG: hypothetical protein DRP70_07850 [Spirochaetota bacterium]
MTGRILCVISILLVISLPLFSAENSEVFTVTNETGFTLSDLYISNLDSEDWGKDLLKGNPLLNGDSLTIPLAELESVFINVRGRDDEGDTYTVYSINAEIDDVNITLNNIDPD